MVLGLLCVASMLSAQEPDHTVGFRELSADAGITICQGGKPYSFVATNLTPEFEAVTRAHEAKHIEQIRRFPNCPAFYRWYGSPQGRLDSEAEAYAAGWCVARNFNADPMRYRQWVFQSLVASSVGKLEPDAITTALKRFEMCP